MKEKMRKIKEVMRSVGSLLGRLLQPRPAPVLQPIPVHSRRVVRR